jgi:subtilisin family serine protease
VRPVRSTITATIVTAAIATSYVAAQASTTTSNPSRDAASTVLVKFQPTASADSRADAVHAVGATEVGTVRDLGVHVLQVPAAAAANVVAALSHRAGVEYAEADATTQATQTPSDPSWGAEWGMTKVSAPAAWDKTTGSSSTVIAILDTGVKYDHADLQNRFVAGYDFVNNDSDPTDDQGHGTAAAGVAGATANNGVGLAGACWTCKLMPVKVLDATGSGDYVNLANGITWAADHGASVISMSLAGTADSSTLHSAVQYAHNHGAVLVAAAGNSGVSTMSYPAAYAEVLGVAGTQSDDTLYSWSNYGSWVKVAAPGCDYTTLISGGYGSFCGTSAATPLVAGIAGLARSLQPTASVAQVEAALESSAVKVGTSVSCGRVDAAAALTALSSGATSASCAPSTSGSTGGTTTTGGGKGRKH